MAITGWILDKSAAARVGQESIRLQLHELAGALHLCPVGELERGYSARSASDHDETSALLRATFPRVEPPPNIFERALVLQRDLAHHHGMWHRTAIPDLLIAETALHNGLGIVHVDRDYERIAEVRPLVCRRLR